MKFEGDSARRAYNIEPTFITFTIHKINRHGITKPISRGEMEVLLLGKNAEKIFKFTKSHFSKESIKTFYAVLNKFR